MLRRSGERCALKGKKRQVLWLLPNRELLDCVMISLLISGHAYFRLISGKVYLFPLAHGAIRRDKTNRTITEDSAEQADCSSQI